LGKGRRMKKIIYWVKCLFQKQQDNDEISYNTIQYGTVLKVYPAARSHVKSPYLVKVIQSDKDGFVASLILDNKKMNHSSRGECQRVFNYNTPEWMGYHKNRFKIINKQS
jgi:hypothetical protein